MPEIQPKALQATPVKNAVSIYDSTRHDISGVHKEFRHIRIELLHPGRYQSRRSFSPRKLGELAASLKATGHNFTPLIVRPTLSGDGFEIICGERRWRAAQLVGMPTLLCCVGDFTPEQALYMCGAENIQRDDLNAIEEAVAYDYFISSGLTHIEVAEELGKSRSHISNYLRLLTLPLAVRDMLEQDQLTFAQARPLCALAGAGVQTTLAQEAVSKNWTSKRIEREVSARQTTRKRIAAPSEVDDCNVERLREIVSLQTGYPCVIKRTSSGSWQLGLSASSTEEFEGILERLGVKTDEL